VKVLIQRVKRAQVRVADEIVGSIGSGLLVLLGVEQGDAEGDADYFADKTAGLRIFRDDKHDMNASVEDVGGEVLVVSQFTLAADTRRGRRPSFIRAAAPDLARSLYGRFVETLRGRGLTVATGRFQAMMEVELVNDGPVTILLEPRAPKADS
jgi:D-tyrosyl-tRNA(Tyr) deacylase